jgi:glycosyltransferase involved in cell wall biosynthesis
MISGKNKALIICLSDPSGDPRPLRAIELCKSLGFDVSVVGYPTNQPLTGLKFISLDLPQSGLVHKIARRLAIIIRGRIKISRISNFCNEYLYGLRTQKETIRLNSYDLIIAEDLQLLPFVFEVKGTAKVLFDAREYYPRQLEDDRWFELFEKKYRLYLCSQFLSKCDAMITVSDGLRKEYHKVFGVNSEVIWSTPNYFDCKVKKTSPENIRMVYHGAANRNRKIENLIEIVRLLDDRFTLDLYLVSNLDYQNELKLVAEKENRVKFQDPIPFKDIIPKLNEYDIGLIYFESTTFNLEFSLPNKFFEYIQARLLIAIGPSPDMKTLVDYYQFGVISSEFTVQSMVNSLSNLNSDDIDLAKKNSSKAAHLINFQKESEKMEIIISQLISTKN